MAISLKTSFSFSTPKNSLCEKNPMWKKNPRTSCSFQNVSNNFLSNILDSIDHTYYQNIRNFHQLINARLSYFGQTKSWPFNSICQNLDRYVPIIFQTQSKIEDHVFLYNETSKKGRSQKQKKNDICKGMSLMKKFDITKTNCLLTYEDSTYFWR